MSNHLHIGVENRVFKRCCVPGKYGKEAEHEINSVSLYDTQSIGNIWQFAITLSPCRCPSLLKKIILRSIIEIITTPTCTFRSLYRTNVEHLFQNRPTIPHQCQRYHWIAWQTIPADRPPCHTRIFYFLHGTL